MSHRLTKTPAKSDEKLVKLVAESIARFEAMAPERQERMLQEQRKGFSRPALCVGDHVEKIAGYKWPGIIIAVFKTLSGHRRFVVECTVPEVAGALHIYSEQQIRAQKLQPPNTLRW